MDALASRSNSSMPVRAPAVASPEPAIMQGATWRDPERVQDWADRAVEIGTGRRMVLLRIPRRVQDGNRAARPRLRREVHDGRPLGVESDRRRDEPVHPGLKWIDVTFV